MPAPTTCPKCGSRKVRTRHLPKYQYRESGLDSVWLEGEGVLETSCEECGARFIAVLNEEQLLQVIAIGLLMRPGFLTGKEIRYLRETCGLTQAQLAGILGKDRRPSISEWEAQPAPTRDQAWEFLLRAALLTEFMRVVVHKKGGHLTRGHVETITDFAGKFSEGFRQFFAPAPQSTLFLVKPTGKAIWRSKKQAAAA